MKYKTSIHPFWFAIALGNIALLVTPGLVLANTLNTIPNTEEIPSKVNATSPSLPSSEQGQVLPEPAEAKRPDLTVIRTFPPLPEQQQAPSLTLTSNQSHLNVQMVNDTNGQISYQVIGMTEERTIPAGSTVDLQGLTIPATLTFQRRDGGLLMATIEDLGRSSPTLQLVLDETATLDESNVALNVEPGGSVFLN